MGICQVILDKSHISVIFNTEAISHILIVMPIGGHNCLQNKRITLSGYWFLFFSCSALVMQISRRVNNIKSGMLI